MSKAIEQSACQLFRAEHLSPLGERQVAGDHGGAPLVALAEHLEEEFGFVFGQRHEAQLVLDE